MDELLKSKKTNNREALIIKSISGEYDCYFDDGSIETCKPLGIFRLNKITPKVGDHVMVSDGMISKIMDRKNDFVRPVVANISKNFIVTSVVEPDLNLNLLDRLIAITEYNDIEGVLLFTKFDLVSDKGLLDDLNKVVDYYKSIGYKVFFTNAELQSDEAAAIVENNKVLEEIGDNICVLSGQSGVGKSTFINTITELNLKTGEISKALGRGKHTTRHTELIRIGDGWVADTPGFGSIDFSMDEVSLSHSFVEFFKTKCKYNGCLHLNEPGCMVKEKVKSGEIRKSRYDNYQLFIKEIRNEVVEYNKKEKKQEVVAYYKNFNSKGQKR